MLTKYKKIILSQVCAVLAVAAILMAWIEHSKTGLWSDPVTRNYLIMAGLLFATEIKLVIDWIRLKKRNPEQ